MSHPDPIQKLREWKKPVVLAIQDGQGGQIDVVLCKKSLIKLIQLYDLEVDLRAYDKYMQVHPKRKYPQDVEK